MRFAIKCTAAVATVVLGASPALAISKYSIIDIDAIDGLDDSRANAINDAGQVTGFLSTAVGSHTFIYSGNVLTDINYLFGGGSIPVASSGCSINGSGKIVGGVNFGTGTGNLFTYSNGAVNQLPYSGITGSCGINNSGQIITARTVSISPTSSYTHAVILNTDGTLLDIGTLGGDFSYGYSINASGQATGYAKTALNKADHAFFYNGVSLRDIGTLGGSYSIGNAINDSGQIAGYSYVARNLYSKAFLYSNNKMTSLGTLGGSNSQGLGINNAGDVVGSSDTKGNVTSHAFIYTGGKMYDLNKQLLLSTGWELFGATGINSAGQIVGYGRFNGAPQHAFLMTPIP